MAFVGAEHIRKAWLCKSYRRDRVERTAWGGVTELVRRSRVATLSMDGYADGPPVRAGMSTRAKKDFSVRIMRRGGQPVGPKRSWHY